MFVYVSLVFLGVRFVSRSLRVVHIARLDPPRGTTLVFAHPIFAKLRPSAFYGRTFLGMCALNRAHSNVQSEVKVRRSDNRK